MKPTIKAIMKEFSVTRSEAREVKELLNSPRHPDDVLEEVKDIIGGYSVEGVRDDTGEAWDSYHCDIIADYINFGDIYDATILYSVEDKAYFITTLGDFMENVSV